jgi:PmbA protein
MYASKNDFENTVRPLAKDLMDYALKNGKDQGVTDVRVVVSSSSKQENSIEKGEVNSVVSGSKNAVSVTLFSGNRVLSFTKNSLDSDKLKLAIDKNIKAISVVPENPHKGLLDASKVYKGPLPDLDLYDKAPPSQQELIDYAKKAEAKAMSNPKIMATRSADVSASKGYTLLLGTNGLDIVTSGSSYQGVVQAVAKDDSGMQIDYSYSIARHFNDMADPESIGEEAALNAIGKLGAHQPHTGKMPVVLSKEAAAQFFNIVFSAIDGTSVHRKTTFLDGKLGQQVMSSGVTIVDNPSVPRALGSSSVDSSGQLSKKLTFIDDGVLKSYNFGLEESRQLGLEPIGRNDGPTNIYVLPGDVSPEDLMKDIKEGVYIEGFEGGTVNTTNGTHSRPASGKLIKDGKLTDTALDGFIVSGNLKDMFMNVMVANDTPALPHTRYTSSVPTTRVNGLTIAGQ